MTKRILHISCSPRGDAAESRRLSDKILALLLEKFPGATVGTRTLGNGAIGHLDRDYAISQQSMADLPYLGSLALSEELVRELEASDILIIGTPMHNLTVPSTLKAWIDHVVRIRRTFNIIAGANLPALRDRPVFVAIASGDRFSGEMPNQPDFLTPYLTAILGRIGLKDLTFFSVQGTAAGLSALSEARAEADRALDEHFHR